MSCLNARAPRAEFSGKWRRVLPCPQNPDIRPRSVIPFSNSRTLTAFRPAHADLVELVSERDRHTGTPQHELDQRRSADEEGRGSARSPFGTRWLPVYRPRDCVFERQGEFSGSAGEASCADADPRAGGSAQTTELAPANQQPTELGLPPSNGRLRSENRQNLRKRAPSRAGLMGRRSDPVAAPAGATLNH